MATPTVSFFNASAGTNSALLVDWMTQLQSMLFAKGWTLAYADADAIGSSLDPSTPAWDKEPATTTDAGVAVYQMPANGHDTQWFVRLRPGWAANTNRPHMRGVQVGTTHDGSGNVSGGSAEAAPTITTSQTDNRQILMAVSEDGFFFTLPGGASSVNVLVERARRSDTGSVTDDLLVLNTFSSAAAALARAGVGEVHTVTPIALGRFNNGTSPTSFGSVSLQNYDGSHVPIVGPFWVRGFPFFHPRLAFLVNPGDHAVNTDRDLFIDGAARTYRAAGTEQGSNWAVWAVATE